MRIAEPTQPHQEPAQGIAFFGAAKPDRGMAIADSLTSEIAVPHARRGRVRWQ